MTAGSGRRPPRVTPIDLGPTAAVVGRLLSDVDDRQLGDPTPCPAWTVADLADHVGRVAMAFAAAADKRRVVGVSAGQADGARLEPGWRARISADLATLVEAWQAAPAWEGVTRIGAVELPADVAGQVCLNELLVHGWDLARATWHDFPADERSVAAVQRFVTPLAVMDVEGAGAFAAGVAVPDDADDLTRVLAHNGRSSAWAPAR